MFCFFKRKTLKTIGTKHPADFVLPYYAELRKRGLNMIEHPIEVVFTTGAICGAAKPGEYIACEIPNTKVIEFDKAYWDTLTDNQRRCLFFHEASHKILSLPHCQPMAIMQPALLSEELFVQNEERLMDALIASYKSKMGI